MSLSVAAVAASVVLSGSATAYSPCDGSSTMTASGARAVPGMVASNDLRLGSWIQMVSPTRVMGRRVFLVADRGGPGFALDFFTNDCGWMSVWGRRDVRFRVLGRGELYRGRPVIGWRVVPGSHGGRLVWRWP